MEASNLTTLTRRIVTLLYSVH